MSSSTHLSPLVAQMLQAPKDERITFCREDRWVAYPGALDAISLLDDLHDHPRSMRMPNLLIVARSGNGKSSILEYFENRHPAMVNSEGHPVTPVIAVEMPSDPTPSSMYSAILWRMAIGHRETDSAKVKCRQVEDILRYAHVRMLLLDEFNNVADAGREARNILSAVRSLSNKLKIPIAAAGTQSAINALNQDPQLKSRFQPFALRAWKLDMKYLQFLASYERLLPLHHPSNLTSEALATLIHRLCGEAIGETVKLLKAAAMQAIKSGTEKITPEIVSSLKGVAVTRWNDVAATI